MNKAQTIKKEVLIEAKEEWELKDVQVTVSYREGKTRYFHYREGRKRGYRYDSALPDHRPEKQHADRRKI